MMEIINASIGGMMTGLSEHASYAYLILFFGSYFETLIGPGFFIYGEFFFLPGAILAGMGVLNIWMVALATLGGGILGDTTSYSIGRRYGAVFFREGRKVFSPENYRRGEAFFAKYGEKGIFFARVLGPLSWITPFLSGVYGVSYKHFWKYNIPGVIVGIGEFLLVGYLFGSQYETALWIIQHYVAYALGGIFAVIVFYLAIKRNNPDFFKNLRAKIFFLKKHE